MTRPIRLPAVTTQCAVVLGSLAVLALTPPATGAMLLVPLGSEPGGLLLDRVVAGGATPLGPGPFDRSLLVWGRRDAIGRAAGAAVLLLAAPAAFCGAPPSVDARAPRA